MKNALLIAGAAVAAFGIYMMVAKKAKKKDCGCHKHDDVDAALVKTEVVPDAVLQNYDTEWRSMFNTPKSFHGAFPVSGGNFKESV